MALTEDLRSLFRRSWPINLDYRWISVEWLDGFGDGGDGRLNLSATEAFGIKDGEHRCNVRC